MKVLFLENRYKTFFWDAVAAGLNEAGFKTAWLVQNHDFMPIKTLSESECICIPYPDKSSLGDFVPEALKGIAARDRNINYFGGNAGHYEYYSQSIEAAILQLRPDLVVGEATLFHEQITIEICKRLGIQYVHPSSCRLPPGRFCLYAYDSMVPLAGSGDVLDEGASIELLDQLAGRKVKIDYMEKPSRAGRLHARLRQLQGWFAVWYARLNGEVFNTPALMAKYRLVVAHRKAVAEWEQLAAKAQLNPALCYVLYPLQMQPECNIDVWGQHYRKQDELVGQIAAALPDGWGLLLKPNPKSKYELLGNMLQCVRASGKVVPLSHSSSMIDALASSKVTITVSGTISLESVFSRRPCYSLAMPYMQSFLPSRHLNDVSQLCGRLESTHFMEQSSSHHPADLLAYQMRSSYSGIISDPLSMPSSIAPENIEKVVMSIISVIKVRD